MSGGLYSRIKTWGDEVLNYSDLNAEFDNVLNNFIPTMMSGYSTNVSQMQTQTSPGSVGSESLATALSGELERLRFQIAAITGNTYWYSSPSSSISQLTAALGAASQANKVSSGLTNGVTGSSQPIFLLPSGSTNSITLKATATPFVYSVAGASYSVTVDTTLTSVTVAPSSNNTLVISDSTIDNSARTKLVGENGSSITVASMGSNITALVGQLAAFKTANATAEYVIARVESTTQLTQVFKGYFFNSSNSLMGRQTVNNAETWTLMKLTWIFINTSGALLPVYTNPRVSGTAPSSPATGDYWFDTVNNYWKTYNGASFVQANATLIGTCIQNTTATVGARSADFFGAYSDLNSIELFTDSSTEVRSKYPGGQVSVYGTTFNFSPDFARWDTPTNNDSGTSVTASNYYYLYVNTQGNPLISDTAPFDRRADLKGFYHPANTYRCLGVVYNNASNAFAEIESFYVSDLTTQVSTMTTAVASFPLPYAIQVKEHLIVLDASGGAFTQVLPPPYQWKGNRIVYKKKDSSLNAITLQSWGDQKLSTTGTVAVGANTITTMASTTGLAAGNLVYGPGILPYTTISTVGSGNVTVSSNAVLAVAGGIYKFANSTGIDGQYLTTLSTQGETVTLESDGTNMYIIDRYIPYFRINSGAVTVTTTGTAATKGTVAIDSFYWNREGQYMYGSYDFSMTATGTAGTGIYLFALPTSLSADPNLTLYYTGTADAFMTESVGSGSVSAVSGPSDGAATVQMYDATHFRISASSLTPAFQAVGGGFYGFNQTIKYAVFLKVPIAGWVAY